MSSATPDSLLEALHWRYATKKFDASKKLSAPLWAALEQTLVLSPSSFGIQPWRFVVVTDPAVREKLSAAAHGQRQPVDCSQYVVFAVRKNFSVADVDHYVARVAEIRSVSVDSLKGRRDSMVASIEKARSAGVIDAWTSHQVYIALGMLLSAAAVLGVDACPMEGIDKAKFDEILGLSAEGYGSLCSAAVGYRAADDAYAKAPKVRFDASEVIKHV